MPSVSRAQARFFRWAEHNPADAKAAGKYPAGMSKGQMHDFAVTKNAGLPERAPKHIEDGMTNTIFQQSEPVRLRASDWMERVRPKAATGEEPVKSWMDRVRPKEHMADGHWMDDAFKNAGKPGHSLHDSLHVAADEKIPAGKLQAATHSKNKHVRKMAQLAANVR